MELSEWIAGHGGVAHRRDLNRAGFTDDRIRRAREAGRVRNVGGGWLATSSASEAVVRAVAHGGRVACVSAAVARGLWVLTADRLHVAVAASSSAVAEPGVRLHRSRPLVPVDRASTIESIIDMLEHVAVCVPFEEAIAIWESTLRAGLVAPAALAKVQWRRLASRALAKAVSMLSDSGLESMVVARLRMWGVDLRQQVRLFGHAVDVLVGERLIIQIDGWEFHSSASARARDNRHDAALRLAGYTVIRIGYAEVVHGWASIERELNMALAQGLHLASPA